MRKRGAHFRNRNAMIPGLIAHAACSEYETRLRLAVDSLRAACAAASRSAVACFSDPTSGD